MSRSTTKKAEEAISFDLSKMPTSEIRAMFRELTPRSLQRWMEYYVSREKYEICTIIKEVMKEKGME